MKKGLEIPQGILTDITEYRLMMIDYFWGQQKSFSTTTDVTATTTFTTTALSLSTFYRPDTFEILSVLNTVTYLIQ